MNRSHTSCALMFAALVLAPGVVFSQATPEDLVGVNKDRKQDDVTHLNVPVNKLVSVESFCILNDNSLTQRFYFDRQLSAPLSIPKGYSFVVTDIIVDPDCAGSVVANPAAPTLAIVEGPLAVRHFGAKFFGKDIKHYALTGGIAYSSTNVPRPRNTTFSETRVEIQLLGYFVRGAAPEPGEPVK